LSKAVLDSSAIIALSQLRYWKYLNQILDEILVPHAVFEEICVKGRGLPGDAELRRLLNEGLVTVRKIRNRVLVDALLDPLALGEAEVLALAIEENADYVVIDDKMARVRARNMGLKVIGTLRILRMIFDANLIDKNEFIRALETLKNIGFRISDKIIERVKQELD